MRDDLPTGTVTFLFTDVEGSTKLLRDLGAEAYADSLAEHRRIVRKACSAEDGVEVDTQGDAFFFVFATASGAVAAAQAMTDALADGDIHLRIGLHTGIPLVTDEGYVGDDVHFAARVAASGHGGQVLLSKSSRELVGGVSVTDLGDSIHPRRGSASAALGREGQVVSNDTAWPARRPLHPVVSQRARAESRDNPCMGGDARPHVDDARGAAPR
jgi:class 3 adenylate cyclase